MRRIGTSFAALAGLFAPTLSAEYRFTPLPETGNAQVEIRLRSGNAKAFRMPAWAPGDYQLFHYGRVVQSLEFAKDGKPAPARKADADPNLWYLPEGADAARYTVQPSRGNFSPNLWVSATQAFVSGPGVFGWFVGDETNEQILHVALKPAGATVHVTLEPRREAPAGFASFRATNYDELLDAPFVVGTGIRTEKFQVGGKPLEFVAFNRPQTVDLAGYVPMGKAVAQASLELFGELPFPRYIFFCDFGGPGGGLEHLNSTRLGLGPYTTGRQAMGLAFHEFVHLYNVKRIRPLGLGPFDYTKPLVMETIWWLEGVTDYYASVLAVRTGMATREAFLNEMAGSLVSFHQNPNRAKVSAEEASRRVWETRGSYGYGGVSYYEKGRLIGLCLDLMIRGKTSGRASLDDVMRTLYEECRDGKPGYREARIRELCVRFGGAELGPFYDRCAKVAGEVPIAEAARAAGLLWNGSELRPDPMAPAARAKVGSHWPSPLPKRTG
jgi:predicted metalloprotease with PDZ domain